MVVREAVSTGIVANIRLVSMRDIGYEKQDIHESPGELNITDAKPVDWEGEGSSAIKEAAKS